MVVIANRVRLSRASVPFGIEIAAVPTGLCAGDAEGQSKVTIGELVTSVNYAIEGCPGSPPLMSVAP